MALGDRRRERNNGERPFMDRLRKVMDGIVEGAGGENALGQAIGKLLTGMLSVQQGEDAEVEEIRQLWEDKVNGIARPDIPEKLLDEKHLAPEHAALVGEADEKAQSAKIDPLDVVRDFSQLLHAFLPPHIREPVKRTSSMEVSFDFFPACDLPKNVVRETGHVAHYPTHPTPSPILFQSLFPLKKS